MKKFLYFISGSIFGVGLIISGMSNPQKVLSFLDIFGNWDPSLMFVMIGAISITAIYFIAIKKSQQNKILIKNLLLVVLFLVLVGVWLGYVLVQQ